MVALESLGNRSLERKFSNVLKGFLNLWQDVTQSVLAIVDTDSLKKVPFIEARFILAFSRDWKSTARGVVLARG